MAKGGEGGIKDSRKAFVLQEPHPIDFPNWENVFFFLPKIQTTH